jgi:hypothetical protein
MDAAWIPIGLAVISLVGSGVALLSQRGKMRMEIDNVALGQANDLIEALRGEVKEARLEIIALRQNIQSLTSQLEASRLEAARGSYEKLKSDTDMELKLLRAEIAALKAGKQ